MLVLGSTLLVTQAEDICERRRRKPVICNRQRTSWDEKAVARVFGGCDLFMSLILSKLIDAGAFVTWKQGCEARMAEC